jgi:CheY-like chemotaxis protein
MPNGGRLAISTALLEVDHQEHVRGLGLEPGPFVQLVVADTGCGMSPQLQARIFEPFFTTKPVGEGTGLGLATVYGIVTQARGAVTVESEEGVGTSFSVLLPIAVARGTSDTHDDIDVEARGAETILFVEDEPGLRALGERLLQHQGYTVLVAGSAEDALRLLEGDPRSIDLLVTDIVMPGLSGRALAAEVRAVQPAVRVLFTSGYPRRGMEITSGFNGSEPVAFLPKPYSREALLRAVRQVLKHA